MAPDRDSLSPGTSVGNYRISRLIGKGGFSLIYLAVDEESGEEVVLKEFMPKKLASRSESLRLVPIDEGHTERVTRARKLFFQEARALTSLRHPNIVQVRGLFLANDTAYMLMQYERGKNLCSYIQARKSGLSTTFVFQVFLPILDALSLMHARSLLHLDIKPGNIHLRHGNEPLLLDFGAAHLLAHESTAGGQVITAGYSPVEQYYRGGRVGPWTDVYAVGASMRTCIEGKTPPAAVDRQRNDVLMPAKRQFRGRYPVSLLEAIDWAMQMDTSKRPQHAGELLNVLEKHSNELPGSHSLVPRRRDLASEQGRPVSGRPRPASPTRRI